MSKLNINNILIIPKIPNAIGDTIDIDFVSDSCKSCVNINPNKNIDEITPKVTMKPKKM